MPDSPRDGGEARENEPSGIGLNELAQGMTKGTPHQLLMAESTKEALRSPHAELVFFDALPIRARAEPVKL